MKKDFIVTSANSPLIINVSEYRSHSLVCTPTSGTYSVEYSVTPRNSSNPINWVADTEITSVNTQKTAEYGKISRLRVTLVSGTSVAVDLL